MDKSNSISLKIKLRSKYTFNNFYNTNTCIFLIYFLINLKFIVMNFYFHISFKR